MHHLLCRRAFFCILEDFFQGAVAARPWVVAAIPPAVREELRLCCMLAVEAQTPLNAPLFPVVAATDASLHSGAVVEAQCSLEEVA